MHRIADCLDIEVRDCLRRALAEKYDPALTIKQLFVLCAFEFLRNLPEELPPMPFIQNNIGELYRLKRWMARLGDASYRICIFADLFEYIGEHRAAEQARAKWRHYFNAPALYDDLETSLLWYESESVYPKVRSPGGPVYRRVLCHYINYPLQRREDWSWLDEQPGPKNAIHIVDPTAERYEPKEREVETIAAELRSQQIAEKSKERDTTYEDEYEF